MSAQGMAVYTAMHLSKRPINEEAAGVLVGLILIVLAALCAYRVLYFVIGLIWKKLSRK